MTHAHAGYYGADSLTTSSGAPVPPGTVVEVLTTDGDPADLFTGRTRVPLEGPAVVDVVGNFGFYAEPGDYDLRVGAGPLVRVATDVDPRDIGTGAGPSGPAVVTVGPPLAVGGPTYLWDLTVEPDAELYALELPAVDLSEGLVVVVKAPHASTVAQEFDVAVPAADGVSLYLVLVLDHTDSAPAAVTVVGAPVPATLGSGFVLRVWGDGTLDTYSAAVVSDQEADLSGFATASALATETAARADGDAAVAAALAALPAVVTRGAVVADPDNGWEGFDLIRVGPPAGDGGANDGGVVFVSGTSRGVGTLDTGTRVGTADPGFRPYRSVTFTESLRSGVFGLIMFRIDDVTGDVTVIDVDPAPVGGGPFTLDYTRSHWPAGPAA